MRHNMTVTALDTNGTPEDRIDAARSRIDACLAGLVPSEAIWPRRLHQAQRHALLSPGKRFRPLLTLFLAQARGLDAAKTDAAMEIGCAVEMVHAASLILDDLPCMDDADLRRNQPTTHVAFGESTAILSATALLNRAFGIIARNAEVPAEQRAELCDLLSYSVGSTGLIAGQMADLDNTGNASVSEIERVNRLKTGALFDFAADAAAILTESSAPQRAALKDFSRQIGLAFQLLDDVKDVLQSPEISGKTSGRDAGKTTLVAKHGLSETKAMLKTYLDNAKTALTRADLTGTEDLSALIDRQFAFMRDL
ncbi:polyprenyl synthetase family protein [uncultured Algimonas sp.]|uniref:polyprenyl synthetase family protein n=1 Tax=uncultured Algimonas sp. TaxID=1547920 RepID=UPI002605F843|nr:polyprenyl synthetase family protein [uncultured Algimonas sp.]